MTPGESPVWSSVIVQEPVDAKVEIDDPAEAVSLESPMTTAEALADRIREQALGTADTVVDRTGIPKRRQDEDLAEAT